MVSRGSGIWAPATVACVASTTPTRRAWTSRCGLCLMAYPLQWYPFVWLIRKVPIDTAEKIALTCSADAPGSRSLRHPAADSSLFRMRPLSSHVLSDGTTGRLGLGNSRALGYHPRRGRRAGRVKTLFVTNDFPPKVGGVSQYVDQIARRFPDGQIRILAPAFPGAASFDASYPHEVIRWGSKVLLPTPGAADRIIDLVGADRPDVMLFGAALPFARLGGAVQRRTGVPFATFTHG